MEQTAGESDKIILIHENALKNVAKMSETFAILLNRACLTQRLLECRLAHRDGKEMTETQMAIITW